MELVWFILVALVLGGYTVLDGFDLGVGIVYPYVTRANEERRTALAAIGPVWDGNEVWLIAGGGVLFFAFPRVYAAAFSGFYLALIILLWLLLLRGLSIELRSELDHPLWQTFWDGTFAFASLLLAFLLGVALGNVLRGVPLNADGYFFTPLWTDFLPGTRAGILDWYTGLVGLLAVAILVVHGASYLVVKTTGEIQERANRVTAPGKWLVVVLAVAAVVVTPVVQPILARPYQDQPAGYGFLTLAVLALAGLVYFSQRSRPLPAFLASGLFILSMLATAAFGLFPHLLIATTEAAHSLTIHNAAAQPYGLRIGLIWFGIGMTLVLAYTTYVYRSFAGKVAFSPGDEGY